MLSVYEWRRACDESQRRSERRRGAAPSLITAGVMLALGAILIVAAVLYGGFQTGVI